VGEEELLGGAIYDAQSNSFVQKLLRRVEVPYIRRVKVPLCAKNGKNLTIKDPKTSKIAQNGASSQRFRVDYCEVRGGGFLKKTSLCVVLQPYIVVCLERKRES